MLRTTTAWFGHEMQKEYPFTAYYYFSEAGKMHYIDEGDGEVLLMIHGNPSWSFTYRKLIKELSSNYRCIAVDLIGFGFSDKPADWTYRPHDHARIIRDFIQYLGLRNITLVVNDWGGPIGLSYALIFPENVKRLVLFNTWMWSLRGIAYYERFSGFMSSLVGRYLIRNHNFFGRVVVSRAIGEKKNFPRHIRRVYYKHLGKPKDRKGSWIFPAELIQSSDWLSELWDHQGLICHKPTLIIWGMKDIAFREDILDKWKKLFLYKSVVELKNAGHFPQEEQSEICIQEIQAFLKKHP